MTSPLVSILVPVYNVERYIERCVVSLMEQTYSELEYVFVDDSSPDRSIELLNEVVNRYPSRKSQVRILRHENNKGLSAARNTAVSAASGDYIWHVDSDDFIAVDSVEQLVSKAQATNSDILVFDVIRLEEKGEKRISAEYKDKESYIAGLLQHENMCAHWNKFYRSEFYKRSGVGSIENIRLAEDYAVTPRLVHMAAGIDVLHKALYFYDTRNQGSFVHNLNRVAIVSQHSADAVLVDYFTGVTDYDKWSGIVGLLKQRSVTSLLKHSETHSWSDIREVYSDAMQSNGKGLKLIDSVIFRLFKSRHDILLSIYLDVYKLIFSIVR